MADDTIFTSPLNFNDGLIGKSINDSKGGISIVFGYVSGLDADLYDLMSHNKGIGIALMDRGIGQKELDLACQSLSDQCGEHGLEMLVTKSDLHFDSRWYLIGDLQKLITLSNQDKIHLPFSGHLNDSVHNELYKRH